MVDLELCCEVLGVRPAVLRLRVQYEFYLRDVMFTRPFGFAMAVLPTIISRELDFFPGPLGKMLASIAWLQPGITHGLLLRTAADRMQRDAADAAYRREAEKALEYMEEKYYMSIQHGWYTTGRNPFRMLRDWKLKYGRDWETVGGSMHWSRLFGRDG